MKNFQEQFKELTNSATTKVKRSLALNGGSYILESTKRLYIDSCNETDSIIKLNVNKVCLSEGSIVFLNDRKANPDKLDWSNVALDEGLVFQNMEYAEWEGLLEIFDEVIENCTLRFEECEEVWNDEDCEWCRVVRQYPYKVKLSDAEGNVKLTDIRYVYKIVPDKLFHGMRVCYEHNETDGEYPYYCPERQEGCYKNELSETQANHEIQN